MTAPQPLSAIVPGSAPGAAVAPLNGQPQPEGSTGPAEGSEGRKGAGARSSRSLRLTAAANIPAEPVRWLVEQWIPAGALTLLSGREGLGKSLYWTRLAAEITTGAAPADVIVSAAEDAWPQTIVPRLKAAGADLDRVLRVDVLDDDGYTDGLTLPLDTDLLAEQAEETGARLIVVDPLPSVLDHRLDTHHDRQLRRALEPLAALAAGTGAAIIGVVHVGKGHAGDPVNAILGSRAFGAVARQVIHVVADPDDENRRIIGVSKSNLGRLDVTARLFSIASASVPTAHGDASVGLLKWEGDAPMSVREASRAQPGADPGPGDAARWLADHLSSQGGSSPASDVIDAGEDAGFSADQVKRAKPRAEVRSAKTGMGSGWVWSLPGSEERTKNAEERAPAPLRPSLPSVPSGGTEERRNGPPRDARCALCGGPLHRADALAGAANCSACDLNKAEARSAAGGERLEAEIASTYGGDSTEPETGT